MENRWSACERGNAFDPDSLRIRARAARRARAFTLTVFACVALAWLAHSWLDGAVDAAARRALLNKEQCAPLRGWAPAVVVLEADGRANLLLFPGYARDDGAVDLVRVRESSELCPATRTVIRQKRVNVTHGPLGRRNTQLEGKAGACVMHLADALKTGKCLL